MTFEENQKKSHVTAKYPNIGNNFVYPVLGLAGETGEVAEKVKKILRDKGGIVSAEDREEIKKELGDVLWYLARVSEEMGLSLEEVAQMNIEKLLSRLERGKIQGEGDNR